MKKTITAIALFASTLLGCAGAPVADGADVDYQRYELNGEVLEVFAEMQEQRGLLHLEVTFFDGIEETFAEVDVDLETFDAEVSADRPRPDVEMTELFEGVPADLLYQFHADAVAVSPVAPEDLVPFEGEGPQGQPVRLDLNVSAVALVELDAMIDWDRIAPEVPVPSTTCDGPLYDCNR